MRLNADELCWDSRILFQRAMKFNLMNSTAEEEWKDGLRDVRITWIDTNRELYHGDH
jgi:hypothetical protein